MNTRVEIGRINESVAIITNLLKDDLWFVIEVPYVDKVYRDSFYSYFSTKLNHEQKDCIRVSLFPGEVNSGQFRNRDAIAQLKESYLGFIIFRPTPPNIIGRSLIAPRAFKDADFECCMVDIPVTVDSVKMNVEGFPHSSQDTETITCAETTLWACMEYFGFRYAEYKPILPSTITKVLGRVAFERQLPSTGLNIRQISSALKEFGFGSKIYFSGPYTPNFQNIFSTYIESGVPVIVGLTDPNNPGTGHAILCVGREKLTDAHIDGCPESVTLDRDIKVYDLDGIDKEFVFIDDNYPPYQKANFNNPCGHYLNPKFHPFGINFFVVPLYSKIYLEAYEAKRFVHNVISRSQIRMADNSEVVMRFYLTSSRSFKDWIAVSAGMQDDLRDIILSTAVPKFIWVTELGTKASFKQDKAKGIILLDATGANTMDLKPLIIAAYEDKFTTFDPDTNELTQSNLTLQEFSIYYNLRS